MNASERNTKMSNTINKRSHEENYVTRIKIEDITNYSFVGILDIPEPEMRQFYNTPILVNRLNELCYGYAQILCAKEKGLKTVKCVYTDSLMFKNITLSKTHTIDFDSIENSKKNPNIYAKADDIKLHNSNRFSSIFISFALFVILVFLTGIVKKLQIERQSFLSFSA